jgi:hypothetical protein
MAINEEKPKKYQKTFRCYFMDHETHLRSPGAPDSEARDQLLEQETDNLILLMAGNRRPDGIL